MSPRRRRRTTTNEKEEEEEDDQRARWEARLVLKVEQQQLLLPRRLELEVLPRLRIPV